jgi:GT2 family glycosyltransferase
MYFSAVIPTFNRPGTLSKCLEKLLNCDPAPQEILVHVDAADLTTEPTLKPLFGNQVRWLHSKIRQGPGGGRNRLIREAKFPIIASFDDDSWPLDQDYFQTATEIFALYPQAAVINCQEIRPDDLSPPPRNNQIKEVNCFQNCACLIRREAFLQTSGYLPLRYAYGMEEADVALQFLDHGWQILESSNLRVFHDTQLVHHNNPSINAAHIANTALLAYLRYPTIYFPLGILQVLNRIKYAASVGRWEGISKGFFSIPQLIWKYRYQRDPVKVNTLILSRQLASKL